MRPCAIPTIRLIIILNRFANTATQSSIVLSFLLPLLCFLLRSCLITCYIVSVRKSFFFNSFFFFFYIPIVFKHCLITRRNECLIVFRDDWYFFYLIRIIVQRDRIRFNIVTQEILTIFKLFLKLSYIIYIYREREAVYKLKCYIFCNNIFSSIYKYRSF